MLYLITSENFVIAREAQARIIERDGSLVN